MVERAPFGSLREYLLSIEESGPLKPVIALEIALQMCRAMQQLSTLGVIHRDLAARNVLVFSISNRSHHDVLVKVSDFGLSRQPPTAGDYYYGGAGRLPVRWSAPEVLQRHKYSEMSDVWALGVVIWEIFSLATVPYYEFSADEQVIRAVVGGAKLPAPAGCPAQVFDRCMMPCWNTPASARPTFEALLQVLRATQEELLVEEALQAQRLCCICLSRPSTHAIVPCGHLCLCDTAECVSPYQHRRSPPCPICRSAVQSLLCTFA